MSADATLPDDDALRAYLDDLRHDVLTSIDAAILGSAAPIERISLMTERRRLLARRHTLEETFVAHAAAWSATERIRRAAFLAEGVSGEILDRAGIRD